MQILSRVSVQCLSEIKDTVSSVLCAVDLSLPLGSILQMRSACAISTPRTNYRFFSPEVIFP